jgi:hypothetical protein
MNAGSHSPWFEGFHIYREPPDRDWRAEMSRLAVDISA